MPLVQYGNYRQNVNENRRGAACQAQEIPCPLASALSKLGSRWALLVLQELFKGLRRFNQLKAFLPCVPERSLAHILVKLQAGGFIERRDPIAFLVISRKCRPASIGILGVK
jgi:DNA-binding HxlR family transcriptional regulator